MKTFVEEYDTVTGPSGEGQDVRKEMTVQVEQWWNSSDVAASLREENEWGPRKTKKMHSCRGRRVCSTNTNTGARRADIGEEGKK